MLSGWIDMYKDDSNELKDPSLFFAFTKSDKLMRSNTVEKSKDADVRITARFKENFQDSFVSISKEISKIHERTLRGSSKKILKNIDNSFYDKGEFVLVVKTSAEDTNNLEEKDLLELLEILKQEGISLKKSVDISNKKLSMSKKTIYSEALKKWDKN